jgi:hypothetical protein
MAEPKACPVCRRMDGGHDQAMHDNYDKSQKKGDGK